MDRTNRSAEEKEAERWEKSVRKNAVRQDLLRQGIQHITLVFGRVGGFFDQVSAALFILRADHVMPRCNVFAAQFARLFIERAEF